MKTLYLNSWNYNSYLIIKELKKEVLKRGGAVVSDWRTKKEENIYIFNRMFKEKYLHDIDGIARMEEYKTTDRPYYQELKRGAEEAQKNYIKSKKRVNNSNYLHFILNDKLYYVELKDNPFFDFFYSKQEIKDNKTEYAVYCRNLEKDFMAFDYYGKVGKTRIKKTALNLLESLETKKDCQVYKTMPRKYNILEV